MHTEVLPLVSVDSTLFLQMINFGIMIILFRIFFYKPLKRVIEQRRRKLSHDIDLAETYKAESLALQHQSEGVLENAHSEAKEIVARALKIAESERERVLDEARESREKLLKQTNIDIDRTLEGVRESLAKESIRRSIELAERIILKNIDEETSRQLIDEFINTLKVQDEK